MTPEPRLVLDRLWPMLVGLAVLLVGALLLEGWAARRGNEPLRISVANEVVSAGEDEEPAAEPGSPEPPAVSPAHAKARLLAQRALYAEAIPLYEEALRDHPDSPVLEAELGARLLAAGQPERALPHLVRADALRPSAHSALKLGFARLRLDDRKGAEQDLRRALAVKPSLAPARITLGTLLRKRGANAEAVALLEAAASSGSSSERARALVALGAAHVAAGRRPEAEGAFDRAIQYAPARAEIRLGIAKAWLASDAREDAERALQVLLRTAELAPDLPAIHAALGRAQEKLGDDRDAVEAYDRALRLEPGNRYARRRLLRLALQAHDFGRARHEADRLVADGPEVPEHHFLAAMVADREGRIADARRAYEKAIAVANGDYPEAFLNLGLLEKGAGNLSASRDAYRKALALRPDYGAAWLNLGKLEEAAADAAAAEAAYRKAVELDPDYAAGWLALGQLQSDARRLDEAAASLRRALQAKPGYDAAELSLGVVAARAGRPQEAVTAYRNVLTRSPRSVSAWYDLGLTLDAAGDAAGARDALGKALAVDPAHVPSRRSLAELDLAAGRLAEARTGFEELLDLAPGDVPARAALAEIAARQGDRAGCEASARRLQTEAPRDPAVIPLLARCATVAPRASIR